MHKNYFGVLSLDAQDVLLKKRPSHAAFVGNEGQASTATSAVAGAIEDDEDWDLEGAVVLDEVERDNAKRRLREFQNSFRGKKSKVPETVSKAFEFTTELDNQEALADARPSAELVSVKDAFCTAQVVPKKAKEQLAS